MLTVLEEEASCEQDKRREVVVGYRQFPGAMATAASYNRLFECSERRRDRG